MASKEANDAEVFIVTDMLTSLGVLEVAILSRNFCS